MQHDKADGRNWQTMALLATIFVFAVVLTLHADWSRFNLDEWGDMVENYAWGVLWQWGYFKHPPFFGWAVAAWFSVMPRTDLSYYVFASLNVVVTLLFLWRIAMRYGDRNFQLFVILCAVLIPPLSFQAIKYNANAAMTPAWAGVFLFYLRGLERQRWYDAVILGVLLSVSMLTKYHSAVLVGALLIHALSDQEARKILLSRFGLIVTLSSMVAFSGHILWLFANDFLPITYAAAQGDGLFGDFLRSLGIFLAGMVVYLLPAVILAVLLRTPGDGYPVLWLGRLGELRQSVAGRALIALGIWPTVLTIGLALAAGADLSVVWVLPLYVPFLLLVALLLPQDLIRRHMPRALVFVGIYFVALLVSAPLYKESIRSGTKQNLTVPIQRMTNAIDGLWEQHAGGTEGYVAAGELLLANGVSFYSRHAAIALEGNSLSVASYLSQDDLYRRGLVIICRAADMDCQDFGRLMTAGREDALTVPFDVEGFDGVRQWPFVATIVKPRS